MTDNVKVHEKAKELELTSKELMQLLNDAGYDYNNPLQHVKSDALQYLALKQAASNLIKTVNQDNFTENAVIVNVGNKYAVVRLKINSLLKVEEISRELFESKPRAYYELNYLNSLLETEG